MPNMPLPFSIEYANPTGAPATRAICAHFGIEVDTGGGEITGIDFDGAAGIADESATCNISGGAGFGGTTSFV